MYLLWRTFYWILDCAPVIALVAWLVRTVDRVRPGVFMNVLNTTIGESWPRRVPGWVNIRVSAVLWKLRRLIAGRRPTKRRAPRHKAKGRPLRLGFMGKLSSALGFPKKLFEGLPPGIELTIVDIRYRGRLAEYLQPLAAKYIPVDLEGVIPFDKELARVTGAIRSADLDLLITVGYKDDTYDILDCVDVPCIVHICTGSDVLHHPSVDFQMYCQPEADYFPIGSSLFCAMTRSALNGIRVYPAWLYFDPRNLGSRRVTGWSGREPLIVFHGSLFKLASPTFLACILDVVAEAGSTEFVFMGKDDRGSLAMISRMVAARGLTSRVHYEGSFSSMRDKTGDLDDPGWQKLAAYLRRARLAPNPWPIGGASARFEAYMLGAPTVHLQLRTDPASWGRPQPTLVEVPSLLVHSGTASSIPEYQELCRRCLSDELFGNRVIQEQLDVVESVGDPTAYWMQVLLAYKDWVGMVGMRQREAQAAHVAVGF